MVTRVSQRLAEGGTPVYYPRQEIVAALNEGSRLFALLTLGLEVTAQWTIPAAQTWFHMLGILPDWIAPLRISTASGAKVRPARVADLNALDSAWTNAPAAPDSPPTRYVSLGADLVGIYKQPPAPGVAVNITYARAPGLLVSDTDVWELPVEYHPRLVDYGVYRPRQVEGAQEFEKTLPLLGSYLEGAQRYADYVRARNQGSRYDVVPFELRNLDRSRLLKLRKDLIPARQG